MRSALTKINELLNHYWAIINTYNYDILELRRIVHHLKQKDFIIIRIRYLDKVSLFVSSNNPADLDYLDNFNLEIYTGLADNYNDLISDYQEHKKLDFYFDPADLHAIEQELEQANNKRITNSNISIKYALNKIFLD